LHLSNGAGISLFVRMKTVLAIDPGTTKSAFILWDGERVINCGILENNSLLELLKSSDLAPFDFAAIEMVACYGMAVGKEVFETVFWIGRFYEVVSRKVGVGRVYRKDVKLHLCNSPRAKDGNIRQALIDKHGVVGTTKNKGRLFGISSHLWAALAVADFALETHQ
jgi:hypothetical protein